MNGTLYTEDINHGCPVSRGAKPSPNPHLDEFEDQDQTTLFGTSLGDEHAAPTEWALIRYMGNPVGEVLRLENTALSIGRSRDNRLCLPELEVSRRHARVELVEQGGNACFVTLLDLGSTNGTYVNGHRILGGAGPVILQHGDVIRLGRHAFKLKHLDDLERKYHEAVLMQTTIDHLTQLGNRASVLGFLERQVDLARRHHRPISVIVCDLDHFKLVNDRFGHALGDRVLQRFGQVVSERLRGSDHVGRIGGEEFLVVLPETQGTEAQAVAEDLRKALETAPLSFLGGEMPFRVTGCFGVAELRAEEADAGSLLARADAALYRAKALGRNRVEYDGPK